MGLCVTCQGKEYISEEESPRLVGQCPHCKGTGYDPVHPVGFCRECQECHRVTFTDQPFVGSGSGVVMVLVSAHCQSCKTVIDMTWAGFPLLEVKEGE